MPVKIPYFQCIARGGKKKIDVLSHVYFYLPPHQEMYFSSGKKNPWSDVGVSDGLKDTDEDCSV